MKYWLVVIIIPCILLGCKHICEYDLSNQQPPTDILCSDTLNVSWSATIQPIINLNCVNSCHNPTTYSGSIDLSTYTLVAIFAAEGSLLNSILQNGNSAPMPYEASKLDYCAIAKVRNWVKDGYAEN